MLRIANLIVLSVLVSCSVGILATEKPALNPLKSYWTIEYIDQMIAASKAANNQAALAEWTAIKGRFNAN